MAEFQAFFFLSLMMSSRFSEAHSIIGRQTVIKERPLAVMEYSTRGGTSGNTLRITKPSCSRFFRVEVSTFCEISGRLFLIAENLIGSEFCKSVCMASSDHLSPILAMIFLIGQSGNSASRISEFSIIMLQIYKRKTRTPTYLHPRFSSLIFNL